MMIECTTITFSFKMCNLMGQQNNNNNTKQIMCCFSNHQYLILCFYAIRYVLVRYVCPVTDGVAKNVQLLEFQTQCPWELHRVFNNTYSVIVSSFCLVHGCHEDNMECGDEAPHILNFGTTWRSVVNLMLQPLETNR